ncbi:MAG TPA: hypothetical protein VNO50_05825 [Pyrinomonadaceae bacterium]|nr:hypothetical protein [Pyrinomonadaceae bacterium]
MRVRPDRAIIRIDWIQRVIDHPMKEKIQKDGRIRRWGQIAEMGDKYLRVILLPDGQTVHKAFFDRSFTP